MTRSSGLAALAVAAGLTYPAAQTPVFRTGTDGVLVDVSVRQDNRAVPGLTGADFELLDRGVPQAIDSSSLETIPIDLTLLLDASGSTEGKLIERLKLGVKDVARLLKSGDRLRVIAVQHVLIEIVPLQAANQPIAIDRLSAQGGTALYDGLAAAMMRSSIPGRRQLVVAYTDGDDASSITSPAQVQEIALHAEAVIHIVVPVENYRAPSAAAAVKTGPNAGKPAAPGAPATPAAFPNLAVLEEAAGRTGGRVFVIDLDDSIGDAFTVVLDDYRRGYVLRYMPAGVQREGWHDIVVRVKKPGAYEVRARKGWGG